MKKIILISFFIGFSYSEEINLKTVKNYKFINLNQSNESNYLYIFSDNKDFFMKNFIKNNIPKINSNINIRYIPIKSEKKICFIESESYYLLSESNCVKHIKEYNIESNILPVILMNDGSRVNNANKINYNLINSYFNLESLNLSTNKKNTQKTVDFKKYEKTNLNKLIWKNYFNKNSVLNNFNNKCIFVLKKEIYKNNNNKITKKKTLQPILNKHESENRKIDNFYFTSKFYPSFEINYSYKKHENILNLNENIVPPLNINKNYKNIKSEKYNNFTYYQNNKPPVKIININWKTNYINIKQESANLNFNKYSEINFKNN